jgi:hypothetical protein
MNLEKNYSIKKFKIGELANTFKAIATKYKWDFNDLTFSISVNSDGLSGSKKITMEEIYSLTEFTRANRSIYCSYSNSKKIGSFTHISLSSLGEYLMLHIESEHIEKVTEINEIFVEHLALVPEEIEFWETKMIKELETRVKALEENVISNRMLSCFISSRFDNKGKIYLPIKEKFLRLLDINVITGLSYEPRRISDKVIDRLENNIDFVVYLVTGGSESFWTRDELVIGKQKGCYSIPLVEKGATFNSGVFGDLEYIEFEENFIEGTFIKLLEGIKYIKNNRRFNIT